MKPRAPRDTPTPVSADYLHPLPDSPARPDHSRRVMIILGTITVTALLIVAAMLIYAFAIPQSTTKHTTSKTPSPTTTKQNSLTAKQAIEHIGVYFKGKDTAQHSITRPVKAPKYEFYTVVPDIAPLVSLAGDIAPEASEAQRDSILKSFDYDKFSVHVLQDGAKQSSYLADITRDDVVCQLQIIKQPDVKLAHRFEVRCLDMTVYSEYASAQSSIVSNYTPLTASSVQYGFIGKPQTKPSPSTGYATVEVPVGTVINDQMTTTSRLALFYRTPDQLWHYFTDRDASVLLECEQYDTVEKKSIYAGSSCRRLKTGTVETVIDPKKKK